MADQVEERPSLSYSVFRSRASQSHIKCQFVIVMKRLLTDGTTCFLPGAIGISNQR